MKRNESSTKQDEDADLKKEAARTRNNSGDGVMAASAQDHELLQLKAKMRRSDKSDTTSAGVTAAEKPRAAMSTTDQQTLLERARAHHLLQAKLAIVGGGDEKGDNASWADHSHNFSIESFVDDDLPPFEIENAPHELLQAKSYIRSSVGDNSSINNNNSDHFRAASPAPVSRYEYRTAMPIQPGAEWEENREELRRSAASARSRSSSHGPAEASRGGDDEDDDDDVQSAEDTLALTATVVDEEQERLRLEQESRQSILDQLTPAVHAEVVDLKKRRRTIGAIVVCVLVVIAALVTALTVASKEANPSPTMSPTVALVDVTDWVTIINNITLSGKTLVYPPPANNATAEEQALAWLIDVEQDEVPVRLAGQHYAILVMALEWNNSKWNITPAFDECELTGVSCNLEGSVYEVDLKGLGLVGTIPPDIALLSDVSMLVLNKNVFQGTVPWVPMMTYMTKMEYIDVDYNSLTGPLPSPWNGTWPAMRIFWAAWNLFSGTISPGYAHWPVLKDLYIKDNKLTGTIPSELGAITTLYWFSVGENFLKGSLPTEIGRWSDITHFEVHQTGKLTGTVPTEVGSWTLVKDVFLFSNQFNGTFPTEIGNWKSLNRLRAEFNSFTGTLPDAIGSWVNTTHFYINSNNIKGTVPAGVTNWTQLEEIELNNNQLTGPFPTGVESWTNLKAGAFFVNELTGSIEGLCGNESRATLSADCCELRCPCCKSCFVDNGDTSTNCPNATAGTGSS